MEPVAQTINNTKTSAHSQSSTESQMVGKAWKNFLASTKDLKSTFLAHEAMADALKDKVVWQAFFKLFGNLILVILSALAYIIYALFDLGFTFARNYFTYLREVFFGPMKAYQNWFHMFDDMEYSALSFFDALEKEIASHKIPQKYKIKRVLLWEGNVFSPRREYLKIRRKNLIIYVGAAQYGKGYFFSWYQAEQRGILFTFFMRLVSLVPLFGKNIVEQYQKQTFYRWDTATMFQQRIHGSIQTVIGDLAHTLGVRELTEEEKQINPIGFKA